MKILIVTDAWKPQVNGVVRALETTARHLEKLGHAVEVIGPDRFRTVPLPTYAEIRLALDAPWRLAGMIEAFAPDAIHIATEGPLGWTARRWCLKRRHPFTTSFHTMFPDYVNLRLGVPLAWSYAVLRRFHQPSAALMVSTDTMERMLAERGFANIVQWARGVDVDLFRPVEPVPLDLPRPILMNVGRVAVEKNIEAFLGLETEGTKVVVGDGPMLATLKTRYPDVVFLGAKHGEDLVRHYCAADVFVFPSRTDTLGLVQLEALACGVPVAAFPVRGPLDIIQDQPIGCLDEDLGQAIRTALTLDRTRCREYALKWSWTASAEEFAGNLKPAPRQ
ncbi:MAG TPA: glycosyltransferase family 1 protein [Alphaproteobacteria bacterium]|nr:glycosyltransferase family 1 protein [Alphaproteobacteria bacterium]